MQSSTFNDALRRLAKSAGFWVWTIVTVMSALPYLILLVATGISHLPLLMAVPVVSALAALAIAATRMTRYR
jgi:hypothetical protein